MNLSYLDMLLATAMVFVVLFSLSTRKGELPEREAKSLVLYLEAGDDSGAIDTSEIAISVERGRDVLGSATLNSQTPAAGDQRKRIDKYLFVDASRFRSDGIVRIDGHPHPGTYLVLSLTREMDYAEYKEELLRWKDQYSALAFDDGCLDWVEEGIQLIHARDVTASSKIDEWEGRTPAYIQTHGTRDVAKNRAILESRCSRLAEVDILTYACIVRGHLQNPKSKDLKSKREEELGVRCRQSIHRVYRHLLKRWGPNSPLVARFPLWVQQGASSKLPYEDELKGQQEDIRAKKVGAWLKERRGYGAEWLITRPNGGPSFFDDMVSTYVAGPVRCNYAYGGRVHIRIGDWERRPEDSGPETMSFSTEIRVPL